MKKKSPSITAEQAIRDVAGVDVMPLIKALGAKKAVSEYKLAKNIKREVNQTRTMLYKLHQANLVSCIRKKDEKKGWYVYYWALRAERINQLVKDREARESRARIAAAAEGHGQTSFQCSQGCTNATLEEAMEMEFRCPECGELMGMDPRGRQILELEHEMPARRNKRVSIIARK